MFDRIKANNLLVKSKAGTPLSAPSNLVLIVDLFPNLLAGGRVDDRTAPGELCGYRVFTFPA